MFGPPGHLYVYFSYGMHWAANVVCGPDGTASGVLLRAGEVVDGVEVARARRGRAPDRDLARGPGRLTQALGLTAEHKGAYLLGGGPVRLEPGPRPETILAGPRVGVSVEADRPWRFWDAGSRFVSDYKRSPRAPLGPLTTSAPCRITVTCRYLSMDMTLLTGTRDRRLRGAARTTSRCPTIRPGRPSR